MDVCVFPAIAAFMLASPISLRKLIAVTQLETPSIVEFDPPPETTTRRMLASSLGSIGGWLLAQYLTFWGPDWLVNGSIVTLAGGSYLFAAKHLLKTALGGSRTAVFRDLKGGNVWRSVDHTLLSELGTLDDIASFSGCHCVSLTRFLSFSIMYLCFSTAQDHRISMRAGLCYRLDYSIHLDRGSRESQPPATEKIDSPPHKPISSRMMAVLAAMSHKPPESYSGTTPLYPSGVIVPAQDPRDFSKIYFYTFFASWTTIQGALTLFTGLYYREIMDSYRFLYPSIQFPATVLGCSAAVLVVAKARGEFATLWQYVEPWTPSMVAKERSASDSHTIEEGEEGEAFLVSARPGDSKEERVVR
ncbi:hypothetical protein RQP46_009715 [Phenoliferia psychrophenolica]